MIPTGRRSAPWWSNPSTPSWNGRRPEDSALLESRRWRRRILGLLMRNSFVSSKTLLRGWLSTSALGLLSAVPLIGHLLAPRRYALLRDWLNRQFLPEPRTELTLMRNTKQSQSAVAGLLTGFAPEEKTERVASVLRPAGLVRGFRSPGCDPGPRIDQPQQSARVGPRLRGLRGASRRTERAAFCCNGQPAGSPRTPAARKASTFPRIPGSSAAITILAATTCELFDLDAVPATHQPDLDSIRNSLGSSQSAKRTGTCPAIRIVPTRMRMRTERFATWRSAANISRSRGPSMGIARIRFASSGGAA